jgi:2-polyprenyl-3-methyl-5-hydroxy-6-metoxy-1,4-benzoquinol methylase
MTSWFVSLLELRRVRNARRDLRQTTYSGSEIADANGIELNTPLTARNICLFCGAGLELVVDDVTDTRFGLPSSYEIHRCVRCGLEQTVPLPSFAELKELYETHYNFGGERDTLYTRLRERFLFSFAYRLWTKLDGDGSFHQVRGTGRLLDIGCNEGRGLRIYARNGFNAEGLELNAAAAAVARQAGFNVSTCLLEDFAPPTTYDVAVLSNVLEHSLNPRRMLRDIHRILASGGQVWIACPNSVSWLRTVFGRSWINWHLPFHISHFSPSTLRQLLADTGYTQVKMRQITPAVWVSQSFIARLFARKGNKNSLLRNPFWVALFALFSRFICFPALWVGNRSGRGDCLLVVATKD